MVTADTYMQYHTTKQLHTRTNPLADILNNINKNLTPYVNMNTNSSNKHSGQQHQQANNNEKGEARDKEQNSTVANNEQRQENTNIPIDKRTISQGSEVIKTRSG